MTNSGAPEKAVPAPKTPLDKAAELWGIEPDFWDIFGKHHVTPPETQRGVLKSLGVDVSSEASLTKAFTERGTREWKRVIPPTIVAGDGALLEIPVRVPADLAASAFTIEVRLENGMLEKVEGSLKDSNVAGDVEIGGKRFVEKRVEWPQRISLGYHVLTIKVGQQAACDARLIVCPERAYLPEWLEAKPGSKNGKRTAGIAVSLYSLRSKRNWGCGDFTDLDQFADWASRELCVSFIALNPLHAIANRAPYNTSPYLPNCSYYRNPVYLDIQRIEQFSQSKLAQRLIASTRIQNEIESLRVAEFVEYERVYRLKMRFLRVLFREFLREFSHDTPAVRQFREFVEREGDLLHRFAVHSALDECLHRRSRDVWNWHSWPAEYRRPDSAATSEFAEKHWRSVLFHKYVQWQIELQLEASQKYARKRGLRIGLYHDLALATDRFGCDLWSHRDFYVSGCRVGSPPDNFAPKGQDWAFPPPNSARHFEDSYRLFAESIRKVCSHGGAMRIDHVMRFFRLFWIPDGMDATSGTYVRERFEDVLHIVALESVRNKTVMIGEDLGTVPDFIREALEKFGILSYRLFYFEQDKRGQYRRPGEYPRQSLVSVTTHDLPTLAGFWSNRDIEARRESGVLTDEQAYWRMLEERAVEKQKMLDLVHELKLLPEWFPRDAREVPELSGDLHNAIVGFLASTPSMMMVLNQEDLFKETEQQNLPGTTAEYPNWRRKMKYSLEDLQTNEFTRNCASMYRGWIERSGRGRTSA